MNRLENNREHSAGAARRESGAADVTPLVNDLTCQDVYRCRRARRALVEMGDAAIPHLTDALKHRKGWVRWEAAKALGQIPGPAATDALVTTLGDGSFDVRWLAAEALIDRGREGLRPLMKALIEGSDSTDLREGAHHVLFDLSHGSLRDMVLPVLQALEDLDPSVEVPLKARTVLGTIGNS